MTALTLQLMVPCVWLQIRRSRSQIDQLSRHRVILRARATERGGFASQDDGRLSTAGSARDGDRLRHLVQTLRLVIAEAAAMGFCACVEDVADAAEPTARPSSLC